MRSGGGGAFLREYHQETNLDRLENLISWTTKYSDVPVSLKTRLGFLESTDILKFGKSLENLGIQFLTIHGRTIKQKYRGAVDLEKIRAVVKLLEIPVVGNGDVRSYEDYIHMKEITGVDAVMIGRAAMSDPFIFRKISETKQAIDQGLPKPEYPDKMTLTQIRTLLQKNDEFITESSRFWNTLRFRRAEMRRLAIWFIKGIPGYKLVRQKLSHMEDLVELKHYIFGTQIEQDFQSQHVKIVEKSNPTIEIR
jgi:tRNA-dihydrouridine synthase B